MKRLQLLEQLSNLHGAPGHEDDVLNCIIEHCRGLIIERDCINNLFMQRKDENKDKPLVALDCHSDEVGFIVENVNQNGTISFLPLGRWHITNIPAHAVVIKNFKGEFIRGVVASKPPHFMSPDENASLPKIEDLVIDIGTGSYAETVEAFSIEIGNPVTPDVQFLYDEKTGIMRGKAFDNRLGCAIVTTIMNELKNIDLPVRPIGVISAQEELGLRGAQVAANKTKPDFAIIFEGCPADDTFKTADKAHGILGKGVQFRVIDAGMVANNRVQNFARKIAEKNNIPYQVIARSGGQTNGSRYHLAHEGIPTLVIGVPSRYIHTHYSYAARNDFENAILLGKKILESLDEDTISSF
ncbi:MAG: M20/M25/M40 family metallo-hydrolase [Candidatus Rifleibacteriota bacterium]